MAQQSMPNNGDNNGGAAQHRRQQMHKQSDKSQSQLTKPTFHDFFGATLHSPSASRGPFSTASDLASERKVGNHLEGVPFYSPRSEISGLEMSNKIASGSKRSHSDSTFAESLEGSHLMKLLRNGPVGERLRRVSDEVRPVSASVMYQPHLGVSKSERPTPVNVGSATPFPSRGGHFVPFVPPALSSRFREANVGPLNISQSAADEGSRTGIKGAGILSAMSAQGGVSERNASGALPGSSRQKGAAVNAEPESSVPLSNRHGVSGTRQMTIFYGGQAHVFDDVHPNKADVIMALAGSNGGSWSTNFSPKSTAKLASESQLPSGEVEAGHNGNNPSLMRRRLCIPGTSSPTGGNVAKDLRNSIQTAEPNSKEKTEQ